jgi:hypothetical protein
MIFLCPDQQISTARSRTLAAARQMSGPVPSPSMYGTIGRVGTTSFPCANAILSPDVKTKISFQQTLSIISTAFPLKYQKPSGLLASLIALLLIVWVSIMVVLTSP